MLAVMLGGPKDGLVVQIPETAPPELRTPVSLPPRVNSTARPAVRPDVETLTYTDTGDYDRDGHRIFTFAGLHLS